MSEDSVSIIVPVLNEADQLESLVQRLRLIKEGSVKEIIIVDGGSTDGTADCLSQDFTVIKSDKGRAKQMNLGAAQATGTWMFFLHADTLLDSQHIREALSTATLGQWGRFDVRLSGQNTWFRVIEFMMNWRSSLTSVVTGDQCLFIRRTLFETIHGFADMPLMEDVEISKRLRKITKPTRIKRHVVTSSRRWENQGIWRTIMLMWRLRFEYWLGVSTEKLAKRYYS